nr:glycosyltransferase [Helicobacter rodentium]
MQNYPILLIATENYVPFAACLMTSIIHNTHNSAGGGQNKPYCFYVLSDSLCATTQEKLLRLQSKLSAIYPCEIFIHLCKDTKFSAKQLPALNGNYVAYYRLFFEKFFPKTAQKVLYLDIDMCVRGFARDFHYGFRR